MGRNSFHHSAKKAAHYKNGEMSHRAPYKTRSISALGFRLVGGSLDTYDLRNSALVGLGTSVLVAYQKDC
jgi:hypothetical protein